jgi:hypothetical protein
MAPQPSAIPAMISPNAIPRFLEHIRRSALPQKIDRSYLQSASFRSSNDTAVIGVLKTIGFLDSDGKPTQLYRDYKGVPPERAKVILGSAVKAAYTSLFNLYPDADRKDDEAIINWIRANSDRGEVTYTRALNTFKVLRDAATFDDTQPTSTETPPVKEPLVNTKQDDKPPARERHIKTRTSPDVTINITLQIEATSDASIYDAFFASMKRHLFPDES